MTTEANPVIEAIAREGVSGERGQTCSAVVVDKEGVTVVVLDGVIRDGRYWDILADTEFDAIIGVIVDDVVGERDLTSSIYSVITVA